MRSVEKSCKSEGDLCGTTYVERQEHDDFESRILCGFFCTYIVLIDLYF